MGRAGGGRDGNSTIALRPYCATLVLVPLNK